MVYTKHAGDPFTRVSERSVTASPKERIKGNSFSLPRDCTGTEQPCPGRRWALTSAHNFHARTHSFRGVECNQGITWRAHHSHHQEEESQLCYHQVIRNFVRGGIRLLPIFEGFCHLQALGWHSKILRKHPRRVHWILLPVTEKALWDELRCAGNRHDFHFNIQKQMLQSV